MLGLGGQPCHHNFLNQRFRVLGFRDFGFSDLGSSGFTITCARSRTDVKRQQRKAHIEASFSIACKDGKAPKPPAKYLILGLYWDYIRVILGLYQGYIGDILGLYSLRLASFAH